VVFGREFRGLTGIRGSYQRVAKAGAYENPLPFIPAEIKRA